jgi:hypothetical protein
MTNSIIIMDSQNPKADKIRADSGLILVGKENSTRSDNKSDSNAESLMRSQQTETYYKGE